MGKKAHKHEYVKPPCAYTAKTKYDADCINAFCRARFALYQKKKQAIIVILSLILIIVGALGWIGTVGAVISIPIGCWLLTSIGSFPKSDADRMINAANGKFPESQYCFDNSGFSIVSGNQANRIEYESITRLIEDDYYFFFFATPKLAYMVHKPGIRPHDVSGFRSYTAQCCKLDWSPLRPWYEFASTLFKNKK